MEANMSQTVSLQNFAEVLCYRVGIEDRSHSINKDITVVVVAITVSADALIFLLLLFQFQKLLSEMSTNGSERKLDFVLARSSLMITDLPSTSASVTICLMVMVLRSKSIASHFGRELHFASVRKKAVI